MSEKALELMKRKNTDYAKADDPFRNFRQHGLLGILVRMGDKLARLESFVENGTLAVVDESVEDCCLDFLNYSILFQGLVNDQEDTKNKALSEVRKNKKTKKLLSKQSAIRRS